MMIISKTDWFGDSRISECNIDSYFRNKSYNVCPPQKNKTTLNFEYE
jgi:hypothetical protein